MLLDTSAWVEYFQATEKGSIIKSFFENNEIVYTCNITIAEISVWCQKNKKDVSGFVELIKKLSKLLELSEDTLIESGRIYNEQRKINGKIGLIDCIIYSAAQIHGLILLTKDNDFKDMNDVITIDEYSKKPTR